MIKTDEYEKCQKQLKEARQMVAWISNEIHRRKVWKKATKRRKAILERLRNKIDSQLMNNNELIKRKEKWLEELRYKKIKLEKTHTTDARIRD